MSGRVKTWANDARLYRLADADDIRETAISVFKIATLPADGIIAAAENRDFGTSQWQLVDQVTSIGHLRGRGRYVRSWQGMGSVVTGTIYALVDGAIGGAILGWLYNLFAALKAE